MSCENQLKRRGGKRDKGKINRRTEDVCDEIFEWNCDVEGQVTQMMQRPIDGNLEPTGRL
jgi:hypothetical protein